MIALDLVPELSREELLAVFTRLEGVGADFFSAIGLDPEGDYQFTRALRYEQFDDLEQLLSTTPMGEALLSASFWALNEQPVAMAVASREHSEAPWELDGLVAGLTVTDIARALDEMKAWLAERPGDWRTWLAEDRETGLATLCAALGDVKWFSPAGPMKGILRAGVFSAAELLRLVRRRSRILRGNEPPLAGAP